MTLFGIDSAPETLDCLALAPHPDDAEMYAGGLLASCARRGYSVGLLDLTRGELASQGDAATRESEAQQAARCLGLTWRGNLGLPDGRITGDDHFGESPSQLGCLVGALRRLRPELVLAPYQHERHPDHEAASQLVARAVFYCGLRRFPSTPALPAFRPRAVLYYQMRTAFEPSFVVDISAVAETKLDAIRAHRSQLERDAAADVAGPGGQLTQTLVSSPLVLSSLEARDRYYGSLIGVTHGEPYLLRETLSISDPLALLRARPDPLLFPARR